jgi:5'(3')-deoxyribonucleotidase
MIGIDLDDTTFNFMPYIIERYNKKYNDNLTIDTFTNYNVRLFIKKECENLFEEFRDDDLFLNATPKDDAVEVITWLNKKDDVIFPTAGHPCTRNARDLLLKRTFSWYKSEQLYMCPDKHLLRIDTLIDDCIDNVIDKHYRAIVFTQPWNKSLNVNNYFGMFRVNNWLDIANIYRRV